MSHEVTVYTRPGCVQCTATKRALAQARVPHLVVDVDDHPEVLDTLRELDALALPVVVTSTGHWTGYRPDQIRALTLTTTQEGSR
ncbi:glutaredoxin domain-containing protein [Pengzhenrongella sp.]|jgi:glutaredoxin-like protein NrdH|uniref:glutaredoxin domain-containing protein n=1 Tax=Pengzhenrongella sp. TaxID=2888820 RepID=UPI002F959DA3